MAGNGNDNYLIFPKISIIEKRFQASQRNPEAFYILGYGISLIYKGLK